MTTEVQSVTAAAAGVRRLTAEYIAARALLDAATLDEAAPKILAAIGDSLDWTHGALWVVDGELDALHLRASDWLQEHGDTEDAIRHAIAGHGWDRAVDLLEGLCAGQEHD